MREGIHEHGTLVPAGLWILKRDVVNMALSWDRERPGSFGARTGDGLGLGS